jgi:hypothetical protein
MATKLTPEQQVINDNLHKDQPELMKKAFKVFSRYARFYGGMYGYEWKGYARLSNDTFVLARLFENDYAEVMLKKTQS